MTSSTGEITGVMIKHMSPLHNIAEKAGVTIHIHTFAIAGAIYT